MTFNFRVFDDEKRALQSKRDRLYTEIENVRAAAGDDPDEGHLEKLERLNAGLAKANEAIRDLEHKGSAELEELMRTHPGSFESGSEPDSRNTRKDRDAVRDVALRCIDRYEDILAPKAGDRLARMVRNDTPRHELSKYVAAVGNPKYDTAFGKALFDPQFGHLRFDAEEVEAVRAVEEARTAMLTSSTGFPLPFALDPSILANSSGALNPVREIARVITITAPTWKGVSSTGVSASYDAEGVEVSDDTPALVQPSITAATGRAFVQFSMEALEDWPGLRQELAQLITDGRDVLDATQFLTGSGTASPGGILNIGGIGGLTTGQRVQSAGSATYATADVYSLVEALAPR